MEGAPKPEGMEIKYIGKFTYKIKKEYLVPVLERISKETGVQVNYILNTLRGAPVNIDFIVDSACSDDDVEKVEQAIEAHKDELRELARKSELEVEGQGEV
ncbi:MAG: hypothetical protein AAB610_00460 [Patescibacteria group bacterium]